MCLNFLYVILGYASSLTKQERRFDCWVPFIIGILSVCYAMATPRDVQYEFIKDIIPFIGTLMGFTLATLTLLLSSSNMVTKTKEYPTSRTIRGKKITMYELLVVFFSHLIIMEALLCMVYYIAFLFPVITWEIGSYIGNTVFIMGIFHVLFTTIRTVANMYFIAIGLR